MTVTARKSTARRPNKAQDPAAELEAAKARAAASGTHLHGMLLEALKGLGSDRLPPKQHRVRRDAYLIVACAALKLVADLVNVRAITLQVPDAAELLSLARMGLQAELNRGHDDARCAFLILDWLGNDRFAWIVNFYAAADQIEAADRAAAKRDRAIAKLGELPPRASATAPRPAATARVAP